MIKFLQTPGKTKKIILGSIIVIFCFAMVITLVPGGILGDSFGFGSLGQNVVAKVGDQDINTQDIDLMARRIAQQQFGGGPFLLRFSLFCGRVLLSNC